jgi:hypothetical protein
VRPQDDGAEDARARWSKPTSTESTATFGLLVGYRSCAFGRILCEEPLGRLAPLDIEIRASEATAQPWEDRLGRD